jgi:NTE family protein
MTEVRVGLVLSGGGAKGAYQVGVLKALLKLGARIDAIAGASIGALNGALLTAAPSMEEGVNRMEEVWLALAEVSPLKIKMPNLLYMLAAFGERMNGLHYINSIAHSIQHAYGGGSPKWLDEWFQIARSLDEGVLSDTPLKKLLDQYIAPDAIATGKPLYVSVYKSQGAIEDILACLVAELGFKDSPNSEFIHIQSLSKNEQQEALLASAAIPLLFSAKQINDAKYSDGGLGGWAKMQGNTPITPLLEAGYSQVIVTHLSDGSLWSRQDFPGATVLEIRPQSMLSREGGTKDLLGFDSTKIPSWIEQGYQDTLACVGRVMNASHARVEWRMSEQALAESQTALDGLDKGLHEAMKRLR